MRVAAVLCLALAGCTSKALLSGDVGIRALAIGRSEDGLVHVVDADGRRTPIDPMSELVFYTFDGRSVGPIPAGEICRTPDAVMRAGHDGCHDATPFVDWTDIEHVEVKTFDGALTAVVASAAVIIIAGGALIARSGSFSAGGAPTNGGSGSGGGSSGGHLHAAPHSTGSGPHVTVNVWNVGRTCVDCETVDRATHPPRASALFTDDEVRKRAAGVFLTLDGGGCALQPDGHCPSGGARGGVRILDFLEISVGARTFAGQGSDALWPQWMGTAGLGFHGTFPRFRRLALAFTLEGGLAGDVWSVGLRPGIRFSPVDPFWIGVYPVTVAYTEWSRRHVNAWNVPSMIEIAAAF